MGEAIYKRELDHSYMVLKCEEGDLTGGYAYRMMTRNRIGKLLDCSQRQMDGETFLYYDISSRQPLERIYEARKLGIRDLSHIIHAVSAMQEDLGEYLLDGQGLLLEAETIFGDVETEELYFCFYPGKEKSVGCYARLADFFLEHVDHGQEHAVNAAYQFYKMSKSDYFVLSSFLPFLDREMAEEKRREERETPVLAEGVLPLKAEYDTAPELDYGMDAQEEDEEEDTKKSFWLFRLFKRRKKREAPVGRTEPLAETVWDSYVEQFDLAGSGETVYFTDLDGLTRERRGIPCLSEEGGERIFPLEDLPMTVGKLKEKVAILLQDSSVSRIHARLEATAEGVGVQDLNSRNGTLVNGEKLSPHESVSLQEGDVVQFGRERFRYGFLDSKSIK